MFSSAAVFDFRCFCSVLSSTPLPLLAKLALVPVFLLQIVDLESFCGLTSVELQVKELRNELRQKSEELRSKEERVKNLTREKQLLEQKVSRLEKNKIEEVTMILVNL